MKIKLKNIEKKINDKLLFSVSEIDLEKGIYIFSGENGCGKSTLFKMINGLDNEYKGNILIDENDVKDLDKQIHNNLIAYQSQKCSLFYDLTFQQNIELILKKYDRNELDVLLEKFNLKEVYKSKKKIGKCSGGEKQKISLVINGLKNLPILMLDEIDNNLDRQSVEAVVDYLSKQSDKIIIIISHNIDFYQELSYHKITFNNKSVLLNKNENKDLNSEVKTSFDNEKVIVEISEKLKVKNTRKLLDNTLGLNIIISVMFLVMSLLLLSIYMTTTENMTMPEANFSENASIIKSPVENVLYSQFGDDSWRKTTKFYFTEADLAAVSNLDYVKKVVPFGTTRGGKNSFAIETAGKNYVIDDKTLANNQLDFSYLLFPQDVRDNTAINEIQGDLIYGKSPKDESDEILISEDYAKKITNNKNIEKLVGNQITIPTTDFQNKSDKKDFKFTVSGIYRPYDKEMQMSQEQYLAFDPNTEIVKETSCFLYPKEQIDRCNVFTNDGDFKFDLQKLADEENLGKYPNIYVEVSKPDDLKKLVDDVAKYDKYTLVDNNYSRKHNNSYQFLQKSLFKQFISMIGLIIVFIVSLFLINILVKNKIKKTKERFIIHGINLKYLKQVIRKNNRIILVVNCILALLFIILNVYFGLENNQVLMGLIIIIVLIVTVINQLILKRREQYGKIN